jgi:hypothetical protein
MDMSSEEHYKQKRVLYSYHEAGHAVVWHVVNGLIEAVPSLQTRQGTRDIVVLVFSCIQKIIGSNQMFPGPPVAEFIPKR